MKKEKLYLIIFWFVTIISFECIFRNAIFHNIIDSDFIEMLFFTLPISSVICLITSLFKTKTNKILSRIILIFLYFMFFSQMVYYSVYHSVFSVYSLTNGGQVLEFYKEILSTIVNSLIYYLLLSVPLVVYFVFESKYFNFEKSKKIVKMCNIGVIVFTSIICLLFLALDKVSIYGSYNLYFNTHAPVLSTKKFGLITTMGIDLKRCIFGLKENNIEIIIDEDETVVDYENYNVLNIDFDEFNTDENTTLLGDYFSSLTGTNKNEYTGMFKDKNVVFILAESFDPLLVSEELTPTLYKLSNSGFNFTNYYAPLYPASTADGEFRTEWSLISSRGDTLTLYAAKDVYNPYLFVNSFSDYNISIYHNYNGDYYGRKTYFESLGYTNFKACNYGLNLECDSFHESDYEMVKETIGDYINSNEKFFAYYITLSGHMYYTKASNKLVEKNWDLVEDLDYSDKVKGYIAANLELENALTYLIDELTKSGKLDDTVIVLTSDHYPYGLSDEEINDASSTDRTGFELYHSDLIIWNNLMDTVTIDKVGSNTDVLPTLLNLFGIEYDSRLLMGKDLLSSSEGLVIMSDRSFITDTITYNSVTDTATVNNSDCDTVSGSCVTVDEVYLNKINNYVDNVFKVSDLVLKTDYYRKIFLGE